MVASGVDEGRTVGRPGSVLPVVGALCCLLYAVTHAWWMLTGPPGYVRVESVVVGGWPVVGVAAVAALVCAGAASGSVVHGPPALRWAWCGVGWACSAVLAAYGMILWPSLAELLLVPFGEPVTGDELAAVGLRAWATAAAALTALSTRPVLRGLRSECPACGRVHGRSPETRDAPTPRWGYLGAYLAVAAMAVREVVALVDGSASIASMGDQPGGRGFLLFLGLMVLAGTLLPLALVHRWGRIWPAWVPLLAGRPVPRWVVLGPGLMMSVGLLVYFGIGGVTAAIVGDTSGVLAIGTYTAWGAGLGVACLSYARLTKAPCPRRRTTAEPVPAAAT